MARPESRLKLGYFPLPDSEAHKIGKLLSFPNGVKTTALDPCAGTGTALLAITAEADDCALYGVELDSTRARACAATGIETIHADFSDVTGMGTMSLVYCNPPYDLDSATDEVKRRQEGVFLQNVTEWLAPGGLLVFVVPYYTLRDCAQRFATAYERVQIFRLTDPQAAMYRQVVVFAVRRKITHNPDYRINTQLREASSHTATIQTLDEAIDEGIAPYPVRRAVPVTVRSTGMPTDVIEDLLPLNQAYTVVSQFLLPPDDLEIKRPPTPLHAGHVGLLCSAGMLNGIFGEGDNRHSARWRTTKYTAHLPQTDEEKEDGITRQMERFTTEVCLLYANGEFATLGAKPPDEKAEAEEAIFNAISYDETMSDEEFEEAYG